MIRTGKLMVLGASACTGMLAVWSSLAGCQGSTSATGEGATGTGGNATAATTGAGGGGSGASTGATTATGGSVAPVAAVIADITGDPASTHVLGPNSAVALNGLVVMSKKYLVSKTDKDSCLWGVFVSAPGLTETAPYSGVLVVSYGTNAKASGDAGGKTYCPILGQGPVGDKIPDDVKPGDIVDVVGVTTNYLPACTTTVSPCATVPGIAMTKVGQVQVGKVVSVTRTGATVALPSAHVLTDAELTDLGGQSSKAFYAAWGGVKVRVASPTALAQVGTPADDGGPSDSLTDSCGHIVVSDSLADGVTIGDTIYYQGALKSSDFCHSGPVYADPVTKFTSIDAFVTLDFCSWGLQANDKCADLSPPSSDANDCNGKATACQ